jgi:hypothetical protein
LLPSWSETTVTDATFDELQGAIGEKGVEAATLRLAEHLTSDHRFHELFDVRLLEARVRLGLPAILTKGLDDLEEPIRTRMEEEYLAACREVGNLLLSDGKVREAWMYLRPVGERAEVAAALEQVNVTDENREQVIEVALHEGVSPRLGFELVLGHYGVCNAISMFDAQMHGRPPQQRQEVAGLLVRHLHGELVRSLRQAVARQEGSPTDESSIERLVADRGWLFENNDYHIDTSHLASVVRFALFIDDPADLRLALDLTEYGRRLSSLYQFAGQEPFVDTYPSHARFLQALLGENVQDNLDWFRQRAANLAGSESAGGGSAPAEVYVALLHRVGRDAEAFEAAAEMLPPGSRTAGFAPSLLELARLSGRYGRLMEVTRQHGDLVGFTLALVAERSREQGGNRNDQ